MQPSRLPARLSGLWFTALLAACGGGGDAPAPEPPSASGSPAPAPVVASTCGLPDFAAAALARMNQWRASGAVCGTRGTFAPTTALAWNTLLTQAADAHSRDMVANNFFSHTGSSGSTLASRVDATGYLWLSLGENIAAGQPSVNSVIDGWIASEGHCANLLNPALTQIGLACVSGTGTASNQYRTYWTMDLGQPQ